MNTIELGEFKIGTITDAARQTIALLRQARDSFEVDAAAFIFNGRRVVVNFYDSVDDVVKWYLRKAG